MNLYIMLSELVAMCTQLHDVQPAPSQPQQPLHSDSSVEEPPITAGPASQAHSLMPGDAPVTSSSQYISPISTLDQSSIPGQQPFPPSATEAESGHASIWEEGLMSELFNIQPSVQWFDTDYYNFFGIQQTWVYSIGGLNAAYTNVARNLDINRLIETLIILWLDLILQLDKMQFVGFGHSSWIILIHIFQRSIHIYIYIRLMDMFDVDNLSLRIWSAYDKSVIKILINIHNQLETNFFLRACLKYPSTSTYVTRAMGPGRAGGRATFPDAIVEAESLNVLCVGDGLGGWDGDYSKSNTGNTQSILG